MPYYEFECKDCKTVTEEHVKMGTKTFPCKSCGKTAVKIMSMGSFHLKGGGWFKDGYASKKV